MRSTPALLLLVSAFVYYSSLVTAEYETKLELFRLAGRNVFAFPNFNNRPTAVEQGLRRRDDRGPPQYYGEQEQNHPEKAKGGGGKGTHPGASRGVSTDVQSSSSQSFPWRTATRTHAIETATATPIKESEPVRFTIKPGEVHRYELTGIPVSDDNVTNVFVTLNICSEPYIENEFDLKPGQVLSLYAAEGNKTGDTMHGMQSKLGFANVTLPNIKDDHTIAEIHAPDLGKEYKDKWTYELGMSTLGAVHAVSSSPNLYLVDTDFANALFVTGNFSQQQEGNHTDKEDFDIYTYPDLNGKDAQQAKFSDRLSGSFCAISSGPALLNTNNTNVTTTRRGYGNSRKGQYYMRGLNHSSTYLSYLTQPNKNMRGGIVFQPVNFTMKSETNCQVVYNLDFCQDTAFAVPGNASAYTAKTLASFYDKMAEDRFKNFSLSLQNVQCNASESTRYSIMRNCDDCAESYKQWLCAVTIPRCTDWSNQDTFLKKRPVGSSRNPMVNDILQPGKYKEILPCADLCYRVVQDCASTLSFKCPAKGRGLESSYGQMSEDGYVSCSYPGAVYFLSNAVKWHVRNLGILALFWLVYLLI